MSLPQQTDSFDLKCINVCKAPRFHQSDTQLHGVIPGKCSLHVSPAKMQDRLGQKSCLVKEESLCDHSESAVASCERVHSHTQAVTVLVWSLIFITGCHQPNTAAFPAPGSTLLLLSLPLCQLQQLCVSWIIKAPAWQLGQPGTGLGPSWAGGLVSLRAHCWCHLPAAREGAGAGGLGLNCLFWQRSGLCQKQLEGCTPRDICAKMRF